MGFPRDGSFILEVKRRSLYGECDLLFLFKFGNVREKLISGIFEILLSRKFKILAHKKYLLAIKSTQTLVRANNNWK